MSNQATFEYELQKIYKRQKEAARELRNFIIKKSREAGKTRKMAAELAGKTRHTLQKIIATKTLTPTVGTLTGLECALKLKPGELVRFIYSASIAGDVSPTRESPSIHLPNSLPLELRENNLLKDHNGLWCAICLAYLEPNEIGDYYPYGQIPSIDDPWLQIALERMFGWTVPTHRYGCPSKGVVLDATSAGSFFNSLLQCPTWKLENMANITFYRGDLPLNVWIRYILSQRHLKRGNKVGAAIELVNATISYAGSVLSEEAGLILWPSHMLSILDGIPYEKARLLLALGNRARNNGHPDYAEKQCYGQAKFILSNMPPKEAKKPLHALERRELSVNHKCASLDEAERLIKDAEYDAEQYGVLTTQNYIALDNFRNNNYIQAEDYFREMEMLFKAKRLNTTVSWWHKMAVWLGLGATVYANDPKGKFEEALSYCLMSEYISAMVGLQVDITRGTSEQLLIPGTLLSPSAVVRKIGQEKCVPKEKMEEIRRTALIESGLQKELLVELSGTAWV